VLAHLGHCIGLLLTVHTTRMLFAPDTTIRKFNVRLTSSLSADLIVSRKWKTLTRQSPRAPAFVGPAPTKTVVSVELRTLPPGRCNANFLETELFVL